MSLGMWWVESVGAVGEWDESGGLGARFFLAPTRADIMGNACLQIFFHTMLCFTDTIYIIFVNMG